MEKNWFPLGGATHLPTVSFVNSWLNCTCCVWINCSVLLFLFILPDSSTGSDSVSIKCIDRSARSFACIYPTLRSPRRPCWRWRPTRTRPRRGRRSPATWVRSLMCSILEDRWDPAGWWCETQVMRPPACTASNRPNTRRFIFAPKCERRNTLILIFIKGSDIQRSYYPWTPQLELGSASACKSKGIFSKRLAPLHQRNHNWARAERG